MNDITPERLAQIKARADNATAGPWQTTSGIRKNAVLIDDRHLLNLWETPNPDENAAFIAAARQDVPDLIAALEAAQAENAKLHEAMCVIAMQRLPAEIASDVRQNLDFEEGYSACVETARAALGAKP